MTSILEADYRVVDVETTGLNKETDRLVEIAVVGKSALEWIVNPGIPIPAEASAVNHLTDRDVAQAPPAAEILAFLDESIPPDCILVAHNAQFDRAFLPCLQNRRWLCSQRLAMHLCPEAPSFKNQVLRYALLDDAQQDALKKELGSLSPHRAKADALVTKAVTKVLLYKYLLRNATDPQRYPDDVDGLIALADSPILLQKISFGKHRGERISEWPLDYIQWCLSPRGMVDMEADLRYTLQEQLKARGVT